MAFIQQYWQYLLGLVLFILNEVVAANPNLKSNSIFQLIMGVLGGLGPKPIDPGGPKPAA